MSESIDVTRLIIEAREGGSDASNRLFEAVYQDLHRLAARALRSTPIDRLRATSLVHEAYLRLARPEAMNVHDRQHLMAVAASAMRQLVIDHARQRNAAKRGGGQEPLNLDQLELGDPSTAMRDADLLALDAGLAQLHRVDPRLGTLVELRFFAGMELEEIAALTGHSVSTLKRDWRKARAFLHSVLGPENE